MKNVMITASIMLTSMFMNVAARPMHNHRRALKVITVTQEVVEIDYVTSTIYVDEPTSTSTTPVVVAATPTPNPEPAVQSTTPVDTPTSTPPAETLSSTTPTEVQASSTPAQVFVAPAPTTTETPEPVITPTLTPEAEPTTSTTPEAVASPTVQAAAASSTPVSSSSVSGLSRGLKSGDGTFYATGLGSCGITSTDTEMIAALGIKTMDLYNPGNPNNNPLCGKQVRAFSESNTEGVVVSIVDTCAGCAGADDLDFSPAAFDKLGLESTGRIPITWEWI